MQLRRSIAIGSTAAILSAIFGASPASAGTDYTGQPSVHENGGWIDLTPYLLTEAQMSNCIGVTRLTNVSPEIADVYVAPYGVEAVGLTNGVTSVSYRTASACDVDKPESAVKSRNIIVGELKQVRYKRLGQTATGKRIHRFTNPNIDEPDFGLEGDVECLYGSFNRPEPDGSVVLSQESSKRVKTARQRIDYVCYTLDDGAQAGYGGPNAMGMTSAARGAQVTNLPEGWQTSQN